MRGRGGAAQMFPDLPAYYTPPDSCILIPTPYLTSCAPADTRRLGPQLPFSHLGRKTFLFASFQVSAFKVRGEGRVPL